MGKIPKYSPRAGLTSRKLPHPVQSNSPIPYRSPSPTMTLRIREALAQIMNIHRLKASGLWAGD
jgi:hypothetical protein